MSDEVSLDSSRKYILDHQIDLWLIQLSGYAWVLSIFFFSYLICEVPSNMILSRTRPSIFLPTIMLVWVVLSAAMAYVQNYGSILAFRFILGCIESGIFPGVLFVMSCWYTTAEIGKRFAIFYSAAVLSGAFGGLLAVVITSNLHNAHSIEGWSGSSLSKELQRLVLPLSPSSSPSISPTHHLSSVSRRDN